MKNYSSPLTTLDLMTVAEAQPLLRRVHAGTYALDALSSLSIIGRPRHLIYNTSPSRAPGEHWISIWLSADTTAEVMDSLGRKPVFPEVLSFLRRHSSRSVYSAEHIQSLTSNACGLYCLSHGLARARGHSLTTWLSAFSDCARDNDQLVYCEFMKRMAFPSLFTPRLRRWAHELELACRRVDCAEDDSQTAALPQRTSSCRSPRKRSPLTKSTSVWRTPRRAI